MGLLSIEVSFLESTKEIFEVESFKILHKEFLNAEGIKFDNCLKQGKLFTKSLAYFKGDECTKQFKDAGIKKWTVETFIFNVYGIQKSWFHKCAKGFESLDKVEEYKGLCDLHGFGYRIEDFNSYVKNGILPQLAIKESKAETETEANDTETEANDTETETNDTLFTLSYKGAKNVCVRIDANKAVHSTNSIAEINEAIKFLKSCLPKP